MANPELRGQVISIYKGIDFPAQHSLIFAERTLRASELRKGLPVGLSIFSNPLTQSLCQSIRSARQGRDKERHRESGVCEKRD